MYACVCVRVRESGVCCVTAHKPGISLVRTSAIFEYFKYAKTVRGSNQTECIITSSYLCNTNTLYDLLVISFFF